MFDVLYEQYFHFEYIFEMKQLTSIIYAQNIFFLKIWNIGTLSYVKQDIASQYFLVHIS